jgi:hypothetical protein
VRRALPNRQGIVSRRTPLCASSSAALLSVWSVQALKAAPRKLATLEHLPKRIVRSILGCWRESTCSAFARGCEGRHIQP